MVKVVCIGTMKAPIDSVGPIVGSFLKPLFKDEINKGNLQIIGDMYNPVHALNLKKKVKGITKGDFVIAVDACVATVYSDKKIGDIILEHNGVKPGSGVGKDLPRIGNMGVAIVTAKEPITNLWIDPMRLIEMAHKATSIICTIIEYKLRNQTLEIEIFKEVEA